MPTLSHQAITAPGARPSRWMLVLHGIYGAGRNWASVARRFVRARPEWGAVLVDLRMHGDSQGFLPPHTLEACARDLAGLVDGLEGSPDAILGHSFGGKVALVYLRMCDSEPGFPDTPEAVWVVDSTPDARQPSGSAWTMLEVLRRNPGPFTERGEGVAAVEAGGFPTPVAQWMATNLVPSGDGNELVWRVEPEAMEALLRDFFDTDAWDVVEDPPAGSTVHIVKAEESEVLDEEACARVETAAGSGAAVQLHRVRGGHWVNADDPDGLHTILEEHMPG